MSKHMQLEALHGAYWLYHRQRPSYRVKYLGRYVR